MKTQEVVFAADLSARSGKPVRLPLQIFSGGTYRHAGRGLYPGAV
jgi:hypothetical protein